jgi:hypothetical protein
MFVRYMESGNLIKFHERPVEPFTTVPTMLYYLLSLMLEFGQQPLSQLNVKHFWKQKFYEVVLHYISCIL